MNTLTALPRVAAYALAFIAGVLLLLLWVHVFGFDVVWLAVLTLAAEVGWLHWDRANVHDKADKATDGADLALGKVENVENLLSGLESPGSGRHALRKAA